MTGKFSVKLCFVSIMKAIYLLPTNNQTLRPKIVQHTKVVMILFGLLFELIVIFEAGPRIFRFYNDQNVIRNVLSKILCR